MLSKLHTRAIDYLLPLFLFFLAFFIYFTNGTLGGLPTDNAVYMYWGQQFLLGKLPYISVFDQKGPATGFITGLFILIGRWLGSDDVKSVMTGFMLNNALAALMIFVFTMRLTHSRALAFLAYGMFLMCYPLAIETSRAPEPKMLVLQLQLLVIFYAVESRWRWSGLICMVSMLIWQPSIVMAIAAFLILVRYKHPFSDYLQFATGLAIPFVSCGLVYAWVGELHLLFEGLIGFNFFDYKQPAFTPWGHLHAALAGLLTWFPYYNWLVILIGCAFIIVSPYNSVHKQSVSFFRYAIGLWLIWLAYDFAYKRLLLFLPYGVIGFALSVHYLTKRINPRLDESRFERPVSWLVLASMCIFTYYSQEPIRKTPKLVAQQTMLDAIHAQSLNTQDVLSCGSLPYIVLSANTDKYNEYDILFRDQNVSVNAFLGRIYPEHKQQMLQKIMVEKPELIVMGDKKACPFLTKDNAALWEEWLHTYYVKYSIKLVEHSPPDNSAWCLACWPLPGRDLVYYVRQKKAL